MSSDLITLLEREATAEREQVLAEAGAQAETIRADARRQADEELVRHRQRLEAEAKAALVRAQSTAHLKASALVLQAKEDAMAEVLARAEAELTRFPGNGQRYPVALRAFIEEALKGLGGHGVVMVNPADQSIAQALVRERGWQVEVRPDAAVQGGVRVSSPDGRFVVTNTLVSRMDRARPMLAADIARTLWG